MDSNVRDFFDAYTLAFSTAEEVAEVRAYTHLGGTMTLKDIVRKRLEELAIREADAREVVIVTGTVDTDDAARATQATYAGNAGQYGEQVARCTTS